MVKSHRHETPLIRRIVSSVMALLLLLVSAPHALAWCSYPGDPECPPVKAPLPYGVTDVTGTIRFLKDGTQCETSQVVQRYDRLYIQLRFFASCLGLKVEWDEQGRFARIWGSISPDRYGHLILRPNNPIVEDRERVDMFHRPTGKERLREQWDLGDLMPIIVDDRMMIPFRFITDYWDLKVDWVPNPRGNGVNEVRVTELDRAVPVEVEKALEDVTITKDGRLQIASKTTWSALPAARRWTERMVLVTNYQIGQLRTKYGTGSPSVNLAKGRVEIATSFGTVHVYRDHHVLWFDQGGGLDKYITALNNETLLDKLMAFVPSAGAAAIDLLAGTTITPYVALAFPVGKGIESVADFLNQQRHEYCKNDAMSLWSTKTGSFDGYRVGFRYGIEGFRCLAEFTDHQV